MWPSASRAWELLNGVKLRSDDLPTTSQFPTPDRPKRLADYAFGPEETSNYRQRGAFPAYDHRSTPAGNGVQDLSTQIMAHMLGLAVPGVEPSTSYYPGYEWWPRGQRSTTLNSQNLSPTTSTPNTTSVLTPSTPTPAEGLLYRPMEGWVQGTMNDEPTTATTGGYSYAPYNPYGQLQ